MGTKAPKKKLKRVVHNAVVCISATYNNTIVTVSEENGNVLAWATAGESGFKGTRKSTPYAAQVAAERVVEKIKFYGVESVKVRVKGIGPGREQAIRGLYGAGLDISAIVDVTPMPHNGTRRKRVRRV